MDNNTKLLTILLVVSVGVTIGIWYYQDSQLKDMEELLRIADEEYVILDTMYIELDKTHEFLNFEFTNLIGEYNTLAVRYSDLEDSIPRIIEDSILLGYNEGNVVGYESGYDEGEDDGYSQGYPDGYNDGSYDGELIGYDSGYNSGYDIGHLSGAEAYAVGEYNGIYWFVRDPTYKEVREFIIMDRTDRISPREDFRCADFAYMLRNNANNEGYRCFGVYLLFETSAHLIIGFNTTDRGMVFIEPQNDYFVELEVGVDYWNTALQSPYDYIGENIIVRWNIHW